MITCDGAIGEGATEDGCDAVSVWLGWLGECVLVSTLSSAVDDCAAPGPSSRFFLCFFSCIIVSSASCECGAPTCASPRALSASRSAIRASARLKEGLSATDTTNMALATVQITMAVQIRPLAEDDYGRNFIEVLEQLSRVGPIDRAFFRARLDSLRNNPRQKMIVAEDVSLHRICGTGTLVMEPKMIRSAGLTGHLEDLVVDQGLRKKGIGRAIVSQLVHMAHTAGCYKVIIDCSEDNVPFYSSCGFKRKDASLVHYYNEHVHALPPPLLADELANDRIGEYRVRIIAPDDYDSNFFELLSQLTVVGSVSIAQFEDRLRIAQEDRNQYTFVVEHVAAPSSSAVRKRFKSPRETDSKCQRKHFVGTGTMFIEQKFIHEAGLAGHIEDVVVSKECRGMVVCGVYEHAAQ